MWLKVRPYLQLAAPVYAPRAVDHHVRHGPRRVQPGLDDGVVANLPQVGRTGRPPLVRTTLSVLTTFPICYAMFMRNHRIVNGNVTVGRPLPVPGRPQAWQSLLARTAPCRSCCPDPARPRTHCVGSRRGTCARHRPWRPSRPARARPSPGHSFMACTRTR